ncbi:MAG: hypothetical protein HDT39_09230 [Lachnospiraceae bacterium]|nr:hypothetical protein [Lachnospiraceae bacterium]
MEKEYRLQQEQLLSGHILNQKILVHCITRLNTKINKAYKKCRIIKASYERNINSGCSNSALNDKQDYEAWKEKYDCLIEQRKPLLDTLLQGYHLSLENAKELIKQADKENFPTYKTVDKVIQMIKCNDFKLE